MPVAVFVFIFSEKIVEVVLGAKWEGGTPFVRAFSFGAFFQPIALTLGPSLVALGKTREYLHIGLIDSLFRVVCIAIGTMWGAIGVAWGTSLGTIFSVVIWIVLGVNKTPVKMLEIMEGISPAAFCSLIMGVALGIIDRFTSINSSVWSVLLFVTLGTCFYLICWVFMPTTSGGPKSAISYFRKAVKTR